MTENPEKNAVHQPSLLSLPLSSQVLHRPLAVPEPALDHLIRLTDDTGLFQHAKFTIPNRAHGYCTDDNARGAISMVKHHALYGDPQALRLLDVYLAFLMHAQNADGSFRNFLEFNRRWWDDEPAHDGLGRALWALGTALANPPSPAYVSVVKDCFDRATGHVQHQSNRGLAYCILGLCEYLKAFGTIADIRQHVELAARRLVVGYCKAVAPQYDPQGKRGHSTSSSVIGAVEPFPGEKAECPLFTPGPVSDWCWFENLLTYDNAVLPHALFVAGRTLGEDEFIDVALQTADFLLKATWRGDHFSFIGTRGWYERGKARAAFDQQPVEAAALAMMLRAAYDATGDVEFLRLQRRAFDWLLGANDLHLPLYDPHTKGCSDGLMSTGVNGNQGAESMVSFLLSLLSVKESRSAIVPPHERGHAPLPRVSLHNGIAAEPANLRITAAEDL
jgi:hypothetical protein